MMISGDPLWTYQEDMGWLLAAGCDAPALSVMPSAKRKGTLNIAQ
jgi:hypothetical protein